MGTPHNEAQPGAVAKTVLMPGDPLRAQYIAQTYLEDAVTFNNVRGMLGFTGRYEGIPVSVMGSGMGMPSIGIYSYELYSQYGVENIIRIGSAGSYTPQAEVYDVVLASAAYSESSYARVQNGSAEDTGFPSLSLNGVIRQAAQQCGVKLLEGPIHSSDVFYREDKTPYYERLYREHGCLCVEMESFALFHNAAVLGKNAACLLTISDSFVSSEMTTPQQRQTSFHDMMRVALCAAKLAQ